MADELTMAKGLLEYVAKCCKCASCAATAKDVIQLLEKVAASPQAGAQREGGQVMVTAEMMRNARNNCKDAKWGESATPAPSEGNESARERIASMEQQPEAPRLGVPPKYEERKP